MPYYCTVPRCTSMAGKAKNVSFHQFPRDKHLASIWNSILGKNKPYTKYSKVCSLHFAPEDYSYNGKGRFRTLKKNSIPSRNLPTSARDLDSPNHAPHEFLVQPPMVQAMYIQMMMLMQANCRAQTRNNEDARFYNNADGGGNDVDEDEGDVSDDDDDDIADDDVSAIGDDDGTDDREDLEELPEELEQSSSVQYAEQGTSSGGLFNQPPNRCGECMKCFKDPDVLTLHRRTHKSTLQANPMLADLLNRPTERNVDGQSNQSSFLSDVSYERCREEAN